MVPLIFSTEVNDRIIDYNNTIYNNSIFIIYENSNNLIILLIKLFEFHYTRTMISFSINVIRNNDYK